MLNFIQMLSAIATATNKLVKLISQYKTKLLDKRKTIPRFCLTQKYAVRCGGGFNYCIGLFDAYLTKKIIFAQLVVLPKLLLRQKNQIVVKLLKSKLQT